jgi:hypothetical protein
MRKLMLLAAMLAMALAAAAPALAQEAPLVDQSEYSSDEGGTTANAALINCQQIIQQIGGDQYAGATGSGEGDAATANNQQFTAEQIQQCLAIVGNNNAGAQNVGDTNVPAPGGGSNGGGSNGGGGSGGVSGGSGGGAGGVAVLPDTGGVPVPALLAGAALISCGLLARRLSR